MRTDTDGRMQTDTDGYPGATAVADDQKKAESDNGPTSKEDGADPRRPRQRSSIGFPYADLGDAEAVAMAIFNAGGECDLNQLAAALGHGKASSGAFRIKLSTAKMFGAVTGSNAALTLTSLGRRLVDEQSRDAARVEAFLSVPLYACIYDEVAGDGGKLPEDAGLEDKIKRLGVVATQADRARQSFLRSAKQAGFNKYGARRLVKPPVSTIDTGTDADPPEHGDSGDQQHQQQPRGDDIAAKPAIITELFRRLPDEGVDFPADERSRWKAVFDASLDLIYGPVVEDQRTYEHHSVGGREG